MKKTSPKTAKKEELKATKDMTFNDILAKFPKAAEILSSKGMHCFGCMMANMETLEDGCKAHGMNDKDIKEVIDEINGK